MAGAWRSPVYVCVCLLVGVGCGEATTEPPEGLFEIAGRYTAMAMGDSAGVALAADVLFDLEHEAGDLSGTFAISGTITDGVATLEILGSGDLIGTASSAAQPAVTVTARTGFCPDHASTFVGTFFPATGILRLGGPVDILGSFCEVVLSFDVLLELHQ
jgi:hypothetical protein